MKKKRHPRLGNGLGTIKYLGSGRTNPYAVYAPEYRITPKGSMVYKRALCYVPDWYTGFAVLVSFRAGTYKPGDEVEIARKAASAPVGALDELSRKIIADYRLIQNNEILSPTLGEVWDMYQEYRFGIHAPKKFSDSTVRQDANARRFFSDLESKRITKITLLDLQGIVDKMAETYSNSYVKIVISQLSTVFSYAAKYDFIKVDYSKRLVVPMIARDLVPGEAFSTSDLKVIYDEAAAGDEIARAILIHCYSGFRISAYYDSFVVDLEKKVFEGGVKTGRRQVPILEELLPFVSDPVWPVPKAYVNDRIRKFCRAHGIRDHSSHDCRHTFKSLMDRFGVNPVAQRLLMGHAPGSDVHDAVYTHYELEDLRRELEKIRIIK